MKVLLTGGSGFLGCELCNELLNAGHEVVVLDDHSRGKPARLERFGDSVQLVDGDVRDYDAVRAATEGCEVGKKKKDDTASAPSSISQRIFRKACRRHELRSSLFIYKTPDLN